MMKLEKQIGKILTNNRLDSTVEALMKTVPFDDLLLAFSNICVFQANREERKGGRGSKRRFNVWMLRARFFHKAIRGKGTVQPRPQQVRKKKDSTSDE